VTDHQPFDLTALQRPSGGYAMLAVDQREALRNMFAEHTDQPVTDRDLQDFKVAATRILTPHASAVLVDKQFAFDAVVEAGAVAEGCGLISSADHFEPAHGEVVGEVTIDATVAPATARNQGAVAMKLLVLWREDQPAAPRIEMVERFVDRARSAGLLSIVEPVARSRADGKPGDTEAGVLAAAKELGSLGADLYKAEVPLKGQGEDAEIRRRSAQLTEAITGPWVVLSSGVPQDRFPATVRLAMSEGADGFLAGRAVWSGCIGQPDVEQALRTDAATRLQSLAQLVDEQMAARA